ncbi:MAG TPA: hypothetical protein VF714_04000 [Jatrophihabitans sp.]
MLLVAGRVGLGVAVAVTVAGLVCAVLEGVVPVPGAPPVSQPATITEAMSATNADRGRERANLDPADLKAAVR